MPLLHALTDPCDLTDPSLRNASPAQPAPLALSDRRNRVMGLNNEQMFYAGLLDQVSLRAMGAWLIYASLGEPIRVQLGDGEWQSTDLAVVPPYAPHRVACDQRLIACLTIEPETVDPAGLPALLRERQGVLPLDPQAAALLARVRQGHAWLRGDGSGAVLQTADFDTLFFGQPFARASAGCPRRAGAGGHAQRALGGGHGAAVRSAGGAVVLALFACVQGRGGHAVSPPAHLEARAQPVASRHPRRASGACGARHRLPRFTHFSHSIRQVYGLKPRDLFAGSRQLRAWGDSPPARCAG